MYLCMNDMLSERETPSGMSIIHRSEFQLESLGSVHEIKLRIAYA